MLLLIVDEAHHATGNHAYAQVGDLYLTAKPDAIVLAATASPGSSERNILEVASRLGIERLDVSRREEPLLQPYGVELNNEPVRIELPDELLTLIFPLQSHQNDEVERLQRMGFLAPTKHLTSKIIEDAECGYAFPANNKKDFIKKILFIEKQQKSFLLKLGQNGRKYYLDKFHSSKRKKEIFGLLNN